jgi:phosphoribosyl 1,2-cyclic phosphodiesterase
VKAIFISHEHSDHIRGLAVLAKKYNLPVFITPGTLLHSGLNMDASLLRTFCAGEEIFIGGLCIRAFAKLHDACDPHSFMISYDGINVGVFTDIGEVCDSLSFYFKQCHAAFLEANYDDVMLDQGRYPYFLKKRIRGGQGHLSNSKALQLFTSLKPVFMSHLLLSHLSKDNNCPKLVHELFNNHADGVEIIVASRYQESSVFEIGITPNKISTVPIDLREPVQMSLF